MARAMTEEAKKEKSEFILNSAFKLYENTTFKTFKMDELAKECNVSKGILFKYFRSKEMLFLSMLDKEYEKMMLAIKRDFEEVSVVNKDNLKEILLRETDNLYKPNSPLIRLNMIKGSILEQNIDYEFAKEQKLKFTKLMGTVMMGIMSKLDGITAEEFSRVFSVQGSLLFGFLHSVTSSKVMKQVIDDCNLTQYEIDPIKETKESLEIFIDGYLK